MIKKIPDYYKYSSKPVLHLSPSRIKVRNQVLDKIQKEIYKEETSKCLLCDSIRYTTIAEKDMYGLPVKTVVCDECDLLYTNPRLSEESLSTFYNIEYRNLDRLDGASIDDFYVFQKYKGQLIYSFLKDNMILDKIEGKMILEIGCGAGGILEYFKERGYSVMGCDLGAEYLNYGIDKGLNLIQGTIKDIDNYIEGKWQNIGLVIYEQVLEHLSAPKIELNLLSSVLQEGTIVYIGVPGIRKIEDNYEGNFIRFLQIPHLLHFSKVHLDYMMRQALFKPIFINEKIQGVFEKTSRLKKLYQEELKKYYPLNNIDYILHLNKVRQQKWNQNRLRNVYKSISLPVRDFLLKIFKRKK